MLTVYFSAKSDFYFIFVFSRSSIIRTIFTIRKNFNKYYCYKKLYLTCYDNELKQYDKLINAIFLV